VGRRDTREEGGAGGRGAGCGGSRGCEGGWGGRVSTQERGEGRERGVAKVSEERVVLGGVREGERGGAGRAGVGVASSGGGGALVRVGGRGWGGGVGGGGAWWRGGWEVARGREWSCGGVEGGMRAMAGRAGNHTLGLSY